MSLACTARFRYSAPVPVICTHLRRSAKKCHSSPARPISSSAWDDDETVGLQVRRILLERAGYRVLTAPDGPSGLELFSREPVEAVVLDFSMPGMTGGEVALNMRKRKPNVPILMLSAYVSLPQEVTDSVNLYMTKGEGAPALLKNLSSLVPGLAPGGPVGAA